MKKVIIIADDFTGALDTGVQFAGKGIATTVTQQIDADLKALFEKFQVVVVDTESRHLPYAEAYRIVRIVADNAVAAGVDIIYKKTDSALRGNIGAEFKAVMDAKPDEILCFAGAFPAVNRVTLQGHQYTDGILISESGFGKDPINPVTESFIPAIIKSQAPEAECTIISKAELAEGVSLEGLRGVVSFDASLDEDLAAIAGCVEAAGHTALLAGCAGFAKHLESLIDADINEERSFDQTDRLMILCGSVNPITREQVEYAQKNGFLRINLLPEQFLTVDYFETAEGKRLLDSIYYATLGQAPVMVCTMDVSDDDSGKEEAMKLGIRPADMANYVTACLGRIAKYVIDMGANYTFAVTGGDTLIGFLKAVDGIELSPVCEVGKGTVLSVMHDRKGRKIQVISKSGGFGEKEIFPNISKQVIKGF